MKNQLLAKSRDIIQQEAGDELLLYNLINNQAYCLNSTSAMVFGLCNGTNSVADISDLMSRKLKTLVSEDFVYLALNDLKKENLLENSDQLPNHFEGLSRREIVKRVGLATLVALPIISTVVAPRAVMAASGLSGVLGVCSTTPNCQTGLFCINCVGGSCSGTKVCCLNPASNLGPGGEVTLCIPSTGSCPIPYTCCNGIATWKSGVGCSGGLGNAPVIKNYFQPNSLLAKIVTKIKILRRNQII